MEISKYTQLDVIPNDFDAEQAILGAIIENNDHIYEVADILKPESFYSAIHQHIFRSMLFLVDNQIPIDEITLADSLKRTNHLEEIGGYAYIASLKEESPSSGNIIFYSLIVKEHALSRGILSIFQEGANLIRDPEKTIQEVLSYVESKISEITIESIGSPINHIKDALSEEIKLLEKISESPEEVIGLKTGFINLDKFTSGLIAPDIYTVAARPGVGKTAFALNVATYVATIDPVLVFSAEMSKLQVAGRAMTSEGRIHATKIKTGSLDADDWDKLYQATDKLSRGHLYIDDKTSDIDQICFGVRRFHKKTKIKLLIIDYLQLLFGVGKNREEVVSYISRKTKALAKELDIPIIQLAQLNRECEKRGDKRPQLSDLRESGSIEQDSDAVIFIYRDEFYHDDSPDKGVAELIFAKHRSGPTGTLKLGYVGKFVRFVNLAEQNTASGRYL